MKRDLSPKRTKIARIRGVRVKLPEIWYKVLFVECFQERGLLCFKDMWRMMKTSRAFYVQFRSILAISMFNEHYSWISRLYLSQPTDHNFNWGRVEKRLHQHFLTDVLIEKFKKTLNKLCINPGLRQWREALYDVKLGKVWKLVGQPMHRECPPNYLVFRFNFESGYSFDPEQCRFAGQLRVYNESTPEGISLEWEENIDSIFWAHLNEFKERGQFTLVWDHNPCTDELDLEFRVPINPPPHIAALWLSKDQLENYTDQYNDRNRLTGFTDFYM